MNKKLVMLAVGATLAGLAIIGFTEGRKESSEERERERPVEAASRVVAEQGGTVVVLDADTQRRAGIAVAPVRQESRPAEIEALATVLAAQDLIELRNACVAAEAEADKAKVALQASRREYERLKALHGDEQAVSAKALEAAEAAWRSDGAAVRAAGAALDAVERGARQKWGGRLTDSVVGNGPLFRRLADQREVLLRIAAPSGVAMAKPPATARLAADDGGVRTAGLVAPSPQADPRIQGATFFYAAPADGLLPGTTLPADLPTDTARAGGIVPAAAVVWWRGKAWVYARITPDRFQRQALPAAEPADRGWFAPGAFMGAQLVVRGAQTLLSEELRSQIQVGEEGEGDE